MRIIEESEDQNTVKTDDGKEHNFVEDIEANCLIDDCSLYEYGSNCTYLCCCGMRKDGKEGCFQLK